MNFSLQKAKFYFKAGPLFSMTFIFLPLLSFAIFAQDQKPFVYLQSDDMKVHKVPLSLLQGPRAKDSDLSASAMSDLTNNDQWNPLYLKDGLSKKYLKEILSFLRYGQLNLKDHTDCSELELVADDFHLSSLQQYLQQEKKRFLVDQYTKDLAQRFPQLAFLKLSDPLLYQQTLFASALATNNPLLLESLDSTQTITQVNLQKPLPPQSVLKELWQNSPIIPDPDSWRSSEKWQIELAPLDLVAKSGKEKSKQWLVEKKGLPSPTYSSETLAKAIHEAQVVFNISLEPGNLIKNVEVTQNGELLMLFTAHDKVMLYDTSKKQLLKTLDLDESIMWASLDPQGRFIFLSYKNRIEKINLDENPDYQTTLLKEFPESSLLDSALSSDGQLISLASYEGKSWILDIGKNQIIDSYSHDGEMAMFTKFSPRDRFIVTRRLNGTVTIYDRNLMKVTSVIEPQNPDEVSDHYLDFKFSPDDQYIVLPTKKDLAQVYNLNNKIKNHLTLKHQNSDEAFDDLTSVNFSSDNQLLASVYNSNFLNVLNLDSGKEVFQLKTRSSFSQAAFSPNGKYLVVTQNDGHVKMINTDQGQVTTMNNLPTSITHVNFTPNSQYALTAALDGKIRFYDLSKNSPQLENFSINFQQGQNEADNSDNDAEVREMSLSADGKILILKLNNNKVKVYQLTFQR